MTFQLGKITFEISFPLTALMTAVIIFDTSLSVVICFAGVILHETGHLLALRHYRSSPEKIKLTLFDIAIVDRKKNTRTDTAELVITLAGVTVNFIMAALFFFLYGIFPSQPLEMLCMTNLTLALFNILPVDSLDGGQALLIILTKFLSPYRAAMVLDIISFMILIPTAVSGFLLLLRSKYNFTLLLTALYLITLILLKNKKN